MTPVQARALSDAMHTLEQDRRDRVREAMRLYDEMVYRPARLDIQACCKALGHGGIRYHDNGLGYTFHFCTICGVDVNREKGDDDVDADNREGVEADCDRRGCDD